MSNKALFLFALAFFQASLVYSQGQQQQGMSGAQMWDPYSWAAPYYAAASNAWADYYKKAQEATNQLYQQWDKTGAGNIFSTGMSFAQQAAQQGARQAEQAAQMAMKEAQQAAQQAAEIAMKEAQQAAQMAMAQGQQGMKMAQQAAQQVL